MWRCLPSTNQTERSEQRGAGTAQLGWVHCGGCVCLHGHRCCMCTGSVVCVLSACARGPVCERTCSHSVHTHWVVWAVRTGTYIFCAAPL